MSELKHRWLRIGSSRMFPCWLIYLAVSLDNHIVYVYHAIGLMNLALNKSAYQTDTYGNCWPGLAVDGVASHNGCSHTLTYDVTWEVDLGELSEVESVVIYNRAANASKYNIVLTRSGLSRFLVTHQHVYVKQQTQAQIMTLGKNDWKKGIQMTSVMFD